MAAKNPITQTPEFIAALGTDDDPVIAEAFGVATSTVKLHRQDHGILAYRTLRRSMAKALIRQGKLSDNAIGERLGMDHRAVARLRSKMGRVSPAVARAERNEARVLAFLTENPDASWGAVGKALDLSRSGVRRIAAKLTAQGLL